MNFKTLNLESFLTLDKGFCVFYSNSLKMRKKRPKADKGGNNILNLILFKNEPKIGRSPKKGEIIFSIQFC